MERIGLAPGSQIGGYTIVAPLGSGGMGTVYRAADDGGTAVALKLLHPQIGADAANRARLYREVAVLQRLRHPAVASVLDAEADSTEAFIVTELVPGVNLADHVHEHGPFGPDELRDLARALSDALEAVHGVGVVHRDLKPTNVVVGRDGPVLIDFGIAQAAGHDSAEVSESGVVVGTPGYLAPELLDGAEPSPETDRWGLAAVLAFAATGRPPFGTRPLSTVLARARSGDADLEGLGPLTRDALRRALDPDPSARLGADDLVAALAVAAVDGDPSDVDPSDVDPSDGDPSDGDPSDGAAVASGAPAAALSGAAAATSDRPTSPGGRGASATSTGAVSAAVLAGGAAGAVAAASAGVDGPAGGSGVSDEAVAGSGVSDEAVAGVEASTEREPAPVPAAETDLAGSTDEDTGEVDSSGQGVDVVDPPDERADDGPAEEPAAEAGAGGEPVADADPAGDAADDDGPDGDGVDDDGSDGHDVDDGSAATAAGTDGERAVDVAEPDADTDSVRRVGADDAEVHTATAPDVEPDVDSAADAEGDDADAPDPDAAGDDTADDDTAEGDTAEDTDDAEVDDAAEDADDTDDAEDADATVAIPAGDPTVVVPVEAVAPAAVTDPPTTPLPVPQPARDGSTRVMRVDDLRADPAASSSDTAAGPVPGPPRAASAAAGAAVGATQVLPGAPDNPEVADPDELALDPGLDDQDADGFAELDEDLDGGADGEAWDPEGVDWIEDDLDASEVVPDGSGYVRPPARRRWGSVLALGALVGATAALAPTVTLIVLVVLLVLVRTFGTAVEAMHGRREQRGVRTSDVPRTVLASPWYLVRSVVALVPSLVVASCVTVLVVGAAAWLVDNGTWTIGDLRSGDDVDGGTAALVAAAAVLLWLVAVWWGPLSRMTRTGARRALAVVAPGRLGAAVLVVVCLLAALVVASLVSNGAGVVWTPAPTPTVP